MLQKKIILKFQQRVNKKNVFPPVKKVICYDGIAERRTFYVRIRPLNSMVLSYWPIGLLDK